MIELSDIEVEAVSGATGLISFVFWGNLAVEFFNGFVDGVNAATQ